MKNLIAFINTFIKRSGNYILISSISSRILSFIASWIALQLIPDKELGIVIYAFQIILFIAPLANLGLNQGLVRYGALLNSIKEKNSLFLLIIKKGITITFTFSIIIFLISSSIKFKNPSTSYYIQLLSICFITQYVFQILQIQFRLQKNNKTFALVEFTYNTILVILVFILSYYFKEIGYAFSIVIAPLLTFLFFIKKLNINWKSKPAFDFINFSFWRYGFFASLATLTTTLLVSIDILLIEHLIVDITMVTIYKYVSLIPYSLIFLSQVVIATDFVEFTENINNKNYIYTYIKNYIIIFILISIGILIVILVFGKFFLTIFGANYASYFSSLITLTIGITGILILRGIFGNLLSSIGKVSTNFTITLIALVLNVILNFYLIPIYGIFGAALTSAILMWFTGFLCMAFFFYYYKKLSYGQSIKNI